MQQPLKEETPYFKYCQKLGGVQRKDIYVSPTKAATFLHLIHNVLKKYNQKCGKEQALKFAQRRICKWDTTIKQDGPHNCRILKPQANKEVNYYIYFKKRINGWQNIGLELYYENKETVADLKQLDLDFDNDALQREIEKNEMKLKDDFKNKIVHLQEFYRELNRKYSFNVNDPDFKEKIKKHKLELINQRNLPVQYFKDKGMKYIELYNEMKQNKHAKSDGILNRLHVFNQLRTENYRVKEKTLGELYRMKKKESQSVNHKDLHDIKIYDNIEEQSEAMLKIIDFPNQIAGKMRNDDKKLTVSSKAIAFAEDFNKTKYIFSYSNQQKKMFEIPEMPLIQIPSSASIQFRKKASTPSNYDDQFDRCLNKYANEVLEYQQEICEHAITTDNIEKLRSARESLRSSQIRRVSKTSHSHQPSIHLDFSKVKSQFQSTRDKDSTKAGNSFHQRQYLVSPFSKS